MACAGHFIAAERRSGGAPVHRRLARRCDSAHLGAITPPQLPRPMSPDRRKHIGAVAIHEGTEGAAAEGWRYRVHRASAGRRSSGTRSAHAEGGHPERYRAARALPAARRWRVVRHRGRSPDTDLASHGSEQHPCRRLDASAQRIGRRGDGDGLPVPDGGQSAPICPMAFDHEASARRLVAGAGRTSRTRSASNFPHPIGLTRHPTALFAALRECRRYSAASGRFFMGRRANTSARNRPV